MFFYLISLRRNHKDHVPRIREYYEEVVPRYTDLQLDLHLDLQFRHHFRVSRPTVQQLCVLLGNWPQVPSEFNCITGRPPIGLRRQVSIIRKSQFLFIEVTKMVSFVNFARTANIYVGFHLGRLHGYFFHHDFWPNLNFPLEYQIKLVFNLQVL